jgi:hypothetical protein
VNYYLLAYVTPASTWRLLAAIILGKSNFDSISKNQTKVLGLILLGSDLQGNGDSVIVMQPIYLKCVVNFLYRCPI